MKEEDALMDLSIKAWVKGQEKLRQLLHRQEGQGMAEYGLILALVAVVVIVAATLLGDRLVAVFQRIATHLN
jgi:pilus assembly protein Flp/PilA